MLKKCFSIMLSMFIVCLSVVPAIANTFNEIDTKIVSDLNINKSSKGQIVQFISIKDITTQNGFIIPKGTLFNGKIISMKKSRFAYRRAKARIEINEMVLSDGRKFGIKGQTKRHVLKGSAMGNVAKGVIGVPAVICTAAVGGAVIIVEACTIIGLVLVPATAAITGGAIGKLTNGVNFKKDAESLIKLQIKANTTDIPKKVTIEPKIEKQVNIKTDNEMVLIPAYSTEEQEF